MSGREQEQLQLSSCLRHHKTIKARNTCFQSSLRLAFYSTAISLLGTKCIVFIVEKNWDTARPEEKKKRKEKKNKKEHACHQFHGMKVAMHEEDDSFVTDRLMSGWLGMAATKILREGN